jgi:poly(A) polymerase
MKLEYVESLILAHPFVKGFEQVSYCLNEEEVKIVAQGETSDVIANRKKEDVEGKEGAGPVYATTFYIGLAIEPRPGIHKSSFSVCSLESSFPVAGAVGPRKLDISYPTTEFTKLVKMWEKFDEGTMGIVVRHIKRLVCLLQTPSNYFSSFKFWVARLRL